MGSSVKAGAVALRLVLLAVLLLGVGVLHTLSHAGAHEGVAVSSTVQYDQQVHAVFERSATPEAVPHAANLREPEGSQHVAYVDSTTVSECFALVPTGSWLLALHGPATCGAATGVEVFRGVPVPRPGPGLKPLRPAVLRI
ncbi:hypothetical protein [Streptomyces canus]|uniref:hypothetical protein n=1 Tax=Streptomyces TaxID=1883 RepID=UPI0036E88D20